MIVSLRASVVDVAQGPADTEYLQYRSPPLNDQEQDMCNSQVIHLETITTHISPSRIRSSILIPHLEN